MKEETKAEETVDKIKKYRSIIFSSGIFAIVLLIVGVLTVNSNKQINLKEKEIYVQVGENYSVEYTLNGLSQDQLVWDSKDDSIVAVSASGNVTGISPGETLVTISSGNDLKEAVRVYVLTGGQKRAAITKDIVPGKKYTCDEDWALEGNKCKLYVVKNSEKCVDGFAETNNMCVKEADATIEYFCPKGYYLYSKEKCISNE